MLIDKFEVSVRVWELVALPEIRFCTAWVEQRTQRVDRFDFGGVRIRVWCWGLRLWLLSREPTGAGGETAHHPTIMHYLKAAFLMLRKTISRWKR